MSALIKREFTKFCKLVDVRVENDAKVLTNLPYEDAYTALYDFVYQFEQSDLLMQGVFEPHEVMDGHYKEHKEFYYLTHLLEQLKKLNPDDRLSATIRSHITDLKETLCIWDD
jgi:hypothetical protein